MMEFRRIGLALALALGLVAGGSSGLWAEERGTRVAIIEMGRILGEAVAIASIQAQGEAQRRVFEQDSMREAERLRAFQEELQRQQALLTAEAMEERQRAFNAELTAADERARLRGQVLQRAVQDGEIQFRIALGTVVAEVAERHAIDIVLPVHNSIFAVAEFDLTDQVVERMNEAFPEIALSFDEN